MRWRRVFVIESKQHSRLYNTVLKVSDGIYCLSPAACYATVGVFFEGDVAFIWSGG